MKEVEDFPEVSIVMLNYNGVQFLQRTIQPVLELDYSNYEFVIVDNGSTDGSLEFIKKFGKIRLIQSPRLREKNFACNYAIKSAQGEYILLLDNDILLTSKDIIKYLLEYSKNIESFGCFGLSLINENENESD
ncbi:MAG: glycosyltransferase family 2 protein, partial [Candidatus Methanoperedens sp.]|nr:glycosyltransferase family 2 protein [Candidatus Methanoperedens sp.]